MPSSPSSTVVHHRWTDIAPEAITPAISRRFISGERVTVARFELKRGGVVPRHEHENEQVTFVISGALKFDLDGRDVVVRGGEVLQIPGGVPHQVEVVEDALVLDVFCPVRQDWIDKTDTYFGR
jgi:quercetin dioxygenase-like cupin family protein